MGEPLVAHVAYMVPFAGVDLVVGRQAVRVGEAFAAHLAHHRFFPRVSSEVYLKMDVVEIDNV